MTPIQAQSLPLILEGRDLIAQAKTGSGKTAAFGLGLLQKINLPGWRRNAWCCAPRGNCRPGGAGTAPAGAPDSNIKVLTLCGGAAVRPQAESLAHGAHVVVGTPGRIQDHLARGSLDLAGLNTLVLDEADRMVDMGFYDDIVAIASHCPTKRQTPVVLGHLPRQHPQAGRPFPAQSGRGQGRGPARRQPHRADLLRDQARGTPDAVARLLAHFRPASTLAFCNTKIRSHDLVEALNSKASAPWR